MVCNDTWRRPLTQLVLAMMLLLAQAFVPGVPVLAAPASAICHTGDGAPAQHQHGQDCLLCPLGQLAAAPAALGTGPSVPVPPVVVTLAVAGVPAATGPPAPPFTLPAARGPPAVCV